MRESQAPRSPSPTHSKQEIFEFSLVGGHPDLLKRVTNRVVIHFRSTHFIQTDAAGEIIKQGSSPDKDSQSKMDRIYPIFCYEEGCFKTIYNKYRKTDKSKFIMMSYKVFIRVNDLDDKRFENLMDIVEQEKTYLRRWGDDAAKCTPLMPGLGEASTIPSRKGKTVTFSDDVIVHSTGLRK
jgi:hypothetical protein